MSSPRVLAARLRATMLIAALALDVAVLTLVHIGHPALSAYLAAAGLTTVSALFIRTHRRLTQVIDQQGALERELVDAHTDPVTGLAGRRIAEQHLDNAYDLDLTLALIDVDDLHGINAAHGHQGGDEYLRALADRLSQAVPGDLVARLGGDEFVVISAHDPLALADRIDAALAAPVVVGHSLLPLQVSTGITQTFGRDPHITLGEADRAMYTAKRRGLHVAFYDPDRDGLPDARGKRPAERPRDRHTTTTPPAAEA